MSCVALSGWSNHVATPTLIVTRMRCPWSSKTKVSTLARSRSASFSAFVGRRASTQDRDEK
jgi:hypothetical protein